MQSHFTIDTMPKLKISQSKQPNRNSQVHHNKTADHKFNFKEVKSGTQR